MSSRHEGRGEIRGEFGNQLRSAREELGRGSGNSFEREFESPTEFLTTITAASLAVPAVFAVLMKKVDGWSQWCIDKKILVDAAADPILPIFGADGAGLDVRRIVLIVVALIAISLAVHTGMGRSRRRRKLDALREGEL